MLSVNLVMPYFFGKHQDITFILAGQDIPLPPGLGQAQLADSLNPIGMVFDHHGNLYIAQKNGQVLLLGSQGHLPASLYLLQVVCAQGRFCLKFVVQG